MTLGLTLIGISAGVLIMLTMLFKAEDARGKRIIFDGTRRWLDGFVIWCGITVSNFSLRIGTGTFRATFHYIAHRVLSAVIRLLTRAENRIARLQLRNKRIAKMVREQHGQTHLEAIAAHKEETSLSDEEKRQRRLH